MESEDSNATKGVHEKNKQKKIEQSDNKKELRIESEKPKVKFTKTSITIK